jgi:hypothetical protein
MLAWFFVTGLAVFGLLRIGLVVLIDSGHWDGRPY